MSAVKSPWGVLAVQLDGAYAGGQRGLAHGLRVLAAEDADGEDVGRDRRGQLGGPLGRDAARAPGHDEPDGVGAGLDGGGDVFRLAQPADLHVHAFDLSGGGRPPVTRPR
ncbi:hypothetical protein GCM10020001_091580 [Nonomuraea salmonea]